MICRQRGPTDAIIFEKNYISFNIDMNGILFGILFSSKKERERERNKNANSFEMLTKSFEI